MRLFISQGMIRALYDDALIPLIVKGSSSIERASHVEPKNGKWVADLSPVGGPKLTRTTRLAALRAERVWIEQHECQQKG